MGSVRRKREALLPCSAEAPYLYGRFLLHVTLSSVAGCRDMKAQKQWRGKELILTILLLTCLSACASGSFPET